ncbi:pyrimidine-nucleoside phosphorylase [Desulfobacterales bacterium HSG17]|nr:pyrimidine-nucleoside phosphorylase [Desulfobacterales bacterium HSG17]
MHFPEIILKKRNGQTLSTDEIRFFIDGYVSGKIPDYQAAAFLMAIWFSKMDDRETTDLTVAMRDSGDVVDLSAIAGIKVDKHSTGGVGDTTTLVTTPLVAACGGKVAKMSGRGLGHTGGTLDKLESIPGASTSQSMERFFKIVSECGLCVIGQTADLVPADKKLYALRDVTATVDNISLIASSVMSKKLASGADAIILDVKTGSGAFMQKKEDAENLARAMVEIGKLAGRRTIALVTDMNQPLGNAVGNALEVREAIEILQGQHEGDLKEVSLALAANMLIVSDLAQNEDQAMGLLNKALTSGKALDHLEQMIAGLDGDPSVCRNTTELPQANRIVPITAEKSGIVSAINTSDIGICALLLGAGRRTKEDQIDPAVGLWMKTRLDEKVNAGDIIAEFYVNDEENIVEATQRFRQAIIIDENPVLPRSLIYSRIS